MLMSKMLPSNFFALWCLIVCAGINATDSLLGIKHLNLTESDPITYLDGRNISMTAQRLGLKLRWFSAYEVQTAPTERSVPRGSEQDPEVCPLFLRKTKFVLNLRERHKWRTYVKADKVLPKPSDNEADTAESPTFSRSASASVKEEGK
jgi:hypothetical protein